MEKDTVLLKLDIGQARHRALVEYCTARGVSLEEGLDTILTQHMLQNAEQEPVPMAGVEVADAHWTDMIAVARKIALNKKFNVYDLVLRMFSKQQLESLKVSSAWHSAFAQWVRQHREFEVVTGYGVNRFRRISDVEAPIPVRRGKSVKQKQPKMTQPQMLNHLKDLAMAWPLGEDFVFDDLLRKVPVEDRPPYLGYGMQPKFRLWVADSGLFRTTNNIGHRTQTIFQRISNKLGE